MGVSMRVVAALLFGSGFAALVYQTAWQRMFRLSFGASTAASAAVLAIFLGGLGLGGALLGKRVERSARPLVFYGNLELGISALAALSPVLGDWVHRFYIALGGTQALGSTGATAVRLMLATLVIGPAAVLMGGTLPAAARAVVAETDQSRRGLALLYSLNTVGAVVGALVGPLFLFAVLGNQLTLWGAVCVNGLVGVAARVLGRRGPELSVAPSLGAGQALESGGRAGSEARLAYVAAGLVGFAFLGLELVWYRVLTPLLGGSSLTFGLILACALAGIGLGGYLFSLRPAQRPVTLQLLALTLSLEAVCVLLPFAWGDGLGFVAAHLRPMLNLGFDHLVAGWLFVAAVVVLPASIVSGYQFPALFALLGRGRERVAQQVGRAYAFNTVGTLSGSLLVGLLLLPSVGAVSLWRGLALALALFGAACAAYALSRGDALKTALWPAVMTALAVLLATASGPGNVFRHSPVGAGRQNIASSSPNEIKALVRARERSIAWSRDGVESTVAIDVDGGISFLVNGKSDGSVVQDRGTQAFLGLLPAALHGHVESAFVVGLGTGMTSGLLARVPGVERVDVAELEPSVTEVALRAKLVNESVLENPKVKVLIGDGRELLLTSKQRYDLVISEPSNPYRAGVASLFTREFYAAAAGRLDRRGLFAQWLQGYEIDARAIAIAVHTLRDVFPFVSLWSPEGADLVLIGSFEPQVVDAERMRRDLLHPAYLKWLRRAWAMEGVEAVVAHSLAPPPVLDRLAATLPLDVNTDDLNALEFEFSRGVGDQRYLFSQDLFATLAQADYRPRVTGSIDWEQVEQLRYRADWGGYHGAKPADAKTRAVMEACAGGSMTGAKDLWPKDTEATDAVEIWVRGYIAALEGAEETRGYAERLEAEGFLAEALLLRERAAEAKNDTSGSVTLLVLALEELRRAALPLCDATGRAIKRVLSMSKKHPERAGELLRALAKGPFAVYIEESHRKRSLMTLASGNFELCGEALRGTNGPALWEQKELELRAVCAAKLRLPEARQAEQDLLRYFENEPVSFKRLRGVTTGEPASVDD